MRRRNPVLRAAGLVLALALVATACGSKSGDKGGNVTGQKGGTFHILSSGDVDYIDPGQIYYTFSYMLFRVMVRTLVTYPSLPGDEGNKLVADIATDTGTVSADMLTYTFTFKPVKYQPEAVGGREVQSADFRYAIERGFYTSVANGYADLYFKDLFVGDEEFVKPENRNPKSGKHITGIDVSDPKKIVFHLKRATGDFLYRLALPLAAPVPEDVALFHDKKTSSTYGPNFAATGPYKLERDASGKVTGYDATKAIKMVRNTNWDSKTDTIRKAYPERIEVQEGFDDTTVATDKILNTAADAKADYNGDFTIPPAKIKEILADPAKRKRIYFNPTNCFRYVFMNTTIKPFDNVKVRQAVEYVLNKAAMRQTRGGPKVGDLASHVLIPGINGFNEAGGKSYDPYKSPDFAGDLERAKQLMKEAGYPDGKYHGKPVLLVGGNAGVATKTTDVVQEGLKKLGIDVKRQEFKPNIMYTKYYSVPSQNVAVGSNPGWCWDYPDSYTVIAPLFDGRKILKVSNNNYALLNDPGLNALIDEAAKAVGSKRAQLWSKVDKKVMDLAPVVPWLWDAQPNLISNRVLNYQFTLSSSSIDLAVVALKQVGA